GAGRSSNRLLIAGNPAADRLWPVSHRRRCHTHAVACGGCPLPLRSENRETRSAASAIIRRMDMDDDACYRAIATRDPRFDGRLFVAVTTTGVYCRPFCPAPTPKRENVRFFPTAA